MQGPQPSGPAPMPLTTLGNEERLLRQSVREFADRAVRPHVRDMDARAAIAQHRP